MITRVNQKGIFIAIIMAMTFIPTYGQTDVDGVMMEKYALCVGPMYGYMSWEEYWEGTFKRDNQNIGKVSTSMFAFMGAYGITSKLNFLFGAPYIKTKASAGTLDGQEGIQDLSLWLKWKAYSQKMGYGRLSLYAIGGYSFPLTNYEPDFLPMSIGLHSKNLSLRAMADYQRGSWFGTISGTYIIRSNIEIDRDAYYTTEMHYTNEVEMPNATSFNVRAGYRDKGLIAEAILDNWTTQGGFDITKNNMPFPSNRMNATRVGFNFKYDMPFHPNLSLTGGAFTTIAGRNMGQATGFNGGIFYVIDFSPKEKNSSDDKK